MKNKITKNILLILTFVLFIWYFRNNESAFQKLTTISIAEALVILLCQLAILLTNAFLLICLAKLLGKSISKVDAFRVTSYSSLINFFGFLQGGVGYRGYYLNKKYKIPLKKYALLTLIQYVFLFGLAAIGVVFGLVLTGQALIILLITVFTLLVATFSYFFTRRFFTRKFTSLTKNLYYIKSKIQSKIVLSVLVLVILQLFSSGFAYFIELSAVGANVSLGSLLIYTGVSQFSILIALTPGALGIREGLLLIVQNQMAVSTMEIVVAGTIDRMMYFITLMLITPFAISMRKRALSKDPSETITPIS